ncbi:MAG: hypothetical protein LBE92_09910 [Chryseobacterium sp.]|jgi:hypothetical protein|uniref:hypothetical protein n=1 Tax=Chryseobacterium sp. TaxID=1871047 RepID=UPI002836C4CF|nr:hypothetical protein [Chryseobacterium sp.]MDR2236429.1 hypothetical protein [Chryseobacterium sp.]
METRKALFVYITIFEKNNMIKSISILPCFMITIFLSCDKKNVNQKNKTVNSLSLVHTEEIKSSRPETNINIKKIDAKKEIRNDGSFNQMTLFEVNNDVSISEIKDYCSTTKSDYHDGYFQILVFFKKTGVAKFPDNPVTGMFMEEEDLKNIKAVYTINNTNGYSKLDYYKDNNLESLPQTINIE